MFLLFLPYITTKLYHHIVQCPATLNTIPYYSVLVLNCGFVDLNSSCMVKLCKHCNNANEYTEIV